MFHSFARTVLVILVAGVSANCLNGQSWNGGTVTNPITAPSININPGGSLLFNVGTSSPIYSQLDLLGSGANGYRLGLVGGGSGDNTLYFDVPYGGNFAFRIPSTPGAFPTFDMFLNSAGNLGIGTISPSARLEVDGNIKLTQGSGASLVFPDGTSQSTAFINNGSATINVGKIVFPDNSSLSSASSLGSSGGGISGQGSPNTIPIFTSSSALGSSNISVQNGNVGIGTAAPTAPLSIATGSPSASNQVFNALTVQPAAGSAYGGNGTSIFLGSVTNYGIQPIAGIWSALYNGGDGRIDYNGSLVFGTTHQGNSSPTEGMRLDPNGNVGIGTSSPTAALEVNGVIKLTSGSGASITFADGTVQSTAYTGSTCSSGGDYAESVDVTGNKGEFEPGDIIVIDPDNPGHFLKSSAPYSSLVAGIYSTKPGYVGRRQTLDPRFAKSEIPMAMVGIVPTKVTTENGPIRVGDLLVTSSRPGYAMHGTDRDQLTGTVVGKALNSLRSGTGVIEVLVSLQ